MPHFTEITEIKILYCCWSCSQGSLCQVVQRQSFTVLSLKACVKWTVISMLAAVSLYFNISLTTARVCLFKYLKHVQLFMSYHPFSDY